MKASGIVSDQIIDGIKVKVLNVHVSNKQNFFQRIYSFLAYSMLSIYYAVTLSADVVIASSGPITAGIPGLFSKWIRRRKLVFEVRDLWPEGAIEMGLIKNKFIIKLAYALEELCYNTADKIITLSPGMSDCIRNKYGYHSIDVPNACDIDLFGQDSGNSVKLPEWTNKTPFAVYAGNIGEINNSKLLFNAAVYLNQLPDVPNVKVVLIGDGPLREGFEAEAKRMSLDNFVLIGLLPKDEVAAWIQKAVCTLIPLVNKPVLNTSSPNKIFDSLAAGTPVIQTTKGWIKDFVLKFNCGINVDPDDASDVANAILHLVDNPDIQKEMGRNAANLAREYFHRESLSKKMLDVLSEVVENEK